VCAPGNLGYAFPMPTRRRTPPPSTSPLAKAGQVLGGLLSSRTAGTTRSRGGRRQPQASGLSKLMRAVRR
jgi:hypothetical protein